ncbi:restriction endonuclease subunit S [Providencia rettgeri]
MSFNWPEFTIDELKAPTKGAIAMGPFGSRIKAENFVDSGVPVLKGGNLHGAYVNDNDCDFLTEEKADELKSSIVYEGDIVITHRGTIGQVSIVSDESKYPRYVVSQSQLKISLDKTKVNPYYVNYYLRSRLGQHQLLSFASQVGVPAIAKASTSVKQIRVPCPPLIVQEKIVDFIRVIDRKHTNNSSINQILEQMAQTIFKSWFVDFDPVKAKMNGKQPEGMDSATASLFPDKLVESELGLIPEGWKPNQLKDILELAYGKALKKTDRVAGDVPVYGSGGLIGNHNQSLVEGPGIIVGRKGTVGSVYWEPKSFYPIDTVFYVKPKVSYSLKYCHLVLQNLGLENMNTDAAVPGLNRNNVYRLDIVTPSKAVLNKFEEIVMSFQAKADANNAQSANLESLRDTILPKLLSGEIELESWGGKGE